MISRIELEFRSAHLFRFSWKIKLKISFNYPKLSRSNMHEENCRSDTVLFQIKDAFRFQYQMSSCVIYFELLSTMNFAISFFLIFHIELELIFKIEIDENEIDFKCQAL